MTGWGWWPWKLLHLGCKSPGLEYTMVLKGYSENRWKKMMWHYQIEAVGCTKLWFVMDHYVSSLKRNIYFYISIYLDMESFFPLSLSEVHVHFTATCCLLFIYCLFTVYTITDVPNPPCPLPTFTQPSPPLPSGQHHIVCHLCLIKSIRSSSTLVCIPGNCSSQSYHLSF